MDILQTMVDSGAFDFVNSVVQHLESSRITTHLVDQVNTVKPYGLDFSDIYHSYRAKTLLGGFDGKRVLELGGALNPHYVNSHLSPRSWTAVEYTLYDDNQYSSDWKHFDDPKFYTYDNSGWSSFFKKWKDLNGLGFNVVYSVAALEHVDEVFQCLCACYEMLDKGGIFYAYFTPIWSAPNGSHGFLPVELGNGNSHEHLQHNFVTIVEKLCSDYEFSLHDASQTAFALYKSQQLNRHTCEDFELMFNASPFKEKQIHPINKVHFRDLYSDDTLATIASCYPHMTYSCQGFECIMRK